MGNGHSFPAARSSLADYQEEIGLRHTPQKKNKTDHSGTQPLVPLRYLIAFVTIVTISTRTFFICGWGQWRRVAEIGRRLVAGCTTTRDLVGQAVCEKMGCGNRVRELMR